VWPRHTAFALVHNRLLTPGVLTDNGALGAFRYDTRLRTRIRFGFGDTPLISGFVRR
jgi:hypothetical protein